MANIFPAIAASLFGGTAAAAGTAAATTAATTAAATTAATTAATISKVLSVGSALMAIGQGIAASNTAKSQSYFADAQAEEEIAAGASERRDLAREYAELRSEQTAIQLANGLDIGVGTPANVAESTARMAERNMDVTRRNAGNRAQLARLRSRGLMSEARASLMGGFGKAAGIGLDSYQLTG